MKATIIDEFSGTQPGFKGLGINKRLYGRADLTLPEQSPVELAALVVPASSDRPNSARAAVHGDGSAFEIGSAIFAIFRPESLHRFVRKAGQRFDLQQTLAQARFGDILQRAVDRRVDPEAAVVELIAVDDQLQLPQDRVHCPIFL